MVELLRQPQFISRELGVSQHLKNAFRKLFIDLGMTWNGLGDLRGGIMIPIVLPAVAN